MSSIKPRQVAVYILISSTLSKTEPSFLIISSRKHSNQFVFPKGGIEEGESSSEAAEREAWEEAGIPPHTQLHLSTLLTLPDSAPHPLSPSLIPNSPTFIPQTIYTIELFLTTTSTPKESIFCKEEDWEERKERKERKFVEGWKALEEGVCWGRKKDLWKVVIEALKARLE